MICPACRAAGQRSTVRVALVDGVAPGVADVKRRTPSDHFYDEDGAEHTHNPNIIVTVYMCANGHRFQERSSWECWCGYKACDAEVTTL